MRSIFSLFLLALFIQNSLSSNDLDVTITGIDVESAGCLPEDPTYGPVFIFYLQIIETGFPVTEQGTKWIIKLDDPYAFATCWIYGNNGKEQKTACTVNLLLTPLKQVKFPAQYSHYDQSYTWTVTGWDKLASKVVFDKSCYPNYLYSFIPSAETREEVDCNSKYNQVTIYGKFEKTSQAQSLRRLSTDVDLEFSPYLIVDGQLSQAKCAYSSLNEANSSEDAMTCLVYGEHSFQFFETAAVDTIEKATVLVGESRQYNLIYCASSFLKLGGIILTSLLLL